MCIVFFEEKSRELEYFWVCVGRERGGGVGPVCKRDTQNRC